MTALAPDMPEMPGLDADPIGAGRKPADMRVVVAMSGGVDSSVVAALLVERGYEVIGITLQLYDHGVASGRKGACCAGRDIHDARDAAARIGIPHYVLDYESRFRAAVMDDFADSYLRGETPLPCVRCNQSVKFRDLVATAGDLGADAVATGHYVRRRVGEDGPELHRAADPDKDQSYFLFATTMAQLEVLRFPLGGLRKPQTRALARRHGLAVADKPDSQDICFVPQGRYHDVVRLLRPGACDPGEIVDLDGRVLGRHAGIIGYTVGQRRGIGIGGRAGGDGEPLFVVELRPDRRQVVVGPRRALARRRVAVREVNWLAPRPAAGMAMPVLVKLRSGQGPAPAEIRFHGADRAEIRLAEPHYGVAPGQAAVCYAAGSGSRLLGGGWIAHAGRDEGEDGAAA